jgi:hypothetical protein
VTLGLGIGANAAIFTIVQEVLLRPLVNRDESRLIYIRQSAPGIAVENTRFSVPELIDLRSGMKTLTALGDFSTIGFTMVGLGGSYFEVMGLRPVRCRLIDATDDGPNAIRDDLGLFQIGHGWLEDADDFVLRQIHAELVQLAVYRQRWPV